MIRKQLWIPIALVGLALGVALAHPHFRKIVEASTQTFQLKISYFTYPFNPVHMAEVSDGFVFNCGNALLTVSGAPLHAGQQAVGPGKYLLRARAHDADHWTLLLIPQAEAGDSRNPSLEKAITLEGTTLLDQPTAHHLTLDITGGHGETDGKVLITVTFGPRTVLGILGV